MRLATTGWASVAAAMAVAPWLAAQRYTPPASDIEPLPLRASCAADANTDVDRGTALLVLLATDEASHAFSRAASVDPDCAMAYVGQAMSALPASGAPLTEGMLQAGAIPAQRAVAVPARTPIERGLVDAVAVLFVAATPTPVGLRLATFEERVCALARAHPDLDALPIFCARAALLRTTMPADAARQRAIRRLDDAFHDRALPAGAAVALLEANEPSVSPVGQRTAGALARVRLAVPQHLLLRASVTAGNWDAAAGAGEAALGYAGGGLAPSLVYGPQSDVAVEWLVEAYLQQGRREAARALLTRFRAAFDQADADVPSLPAWRRGLTRAAARIGLDERSSTPAPGAAADRADADGDGWPWRFSYGFVDAWHAWPGDPARLREAGAIRDALAADASDPPDPEREIARTLIEATMAASQDEHPSVTLLLSHAADRESELLKTGRMSLPLLPSRELASEIRLRFYRYGDAERESRAALERTPNRWRAWLTMARASAALGRTDAARAAYRQVAALRANADADDAARREAREKLEDGPR